MRKVFKSPRTPPEKSYVYTRATRHPDRERTYRVGGESELMSCRIATSRH